jgi:hypothetical protein
MKMKYSFKFFEKVNACYNVHKKLSQWQFSTCHGGYLKKNYDESFKINYGLHPNLALCCEIGAHMNDSIINWRTFLVCHNFGATLQL